MFIYVRGIRNTPQKTEGAAAADMLAGFSDGPGFQPTGFEVSWRNTGTLENEREDDQMGSSSNLEKN